MYIKVRSWNTSLTILYSLSPSSSSRSFSSAANTSLKIRLYCDDPLGNTLRSKILLSCIRSFFFSLIYITIAWDSLSIDSSIRLIDWETFSSEFKLRSLAFNAFTPIGLVSETRILLVSIPYSFKTATDAWEVWVLCGYFVTISSMIFPTWFVTAGSSGKAYWKYFHLNLGWCVRNSAAALYENGGARFSVPSFSVRPARFHYMLVTSYSRSSYVVPLGSPFIIRVRAAR